MEFNLSTSLIIMLFIGVCLVPIFLTKGNKKKRENAILQILNTIASKHNGKVGQFEISGDIAIGIDEANHFVYFYKKTKDKLEELYVDLSKVKSCKTNNISKVIKESEYNQKIIEKLELKFIPFSPNENEVKFDFYDAEESMQLNGELQVIQKWTDLLNVHIKQMN